MTARQEHDEQRLEDAARAGWLYYVAGNTQDEIAGKFGISRQSAQRLVAFAMAEGLIKVSVAHPIASCLSLAAELKSRFALDHVEVVPSDPKSSDNTIGVAEAAAGEIERHLSTVAPIVMAIGTGRTLKAAIDRLAPMNCPQHRIVSLTGSIAPDGSAAYYNVIFNIANATRARCFPLPLPVISATAEERALLHQQALVHRTLETAAQADFTLVGIGDLGPEAPLLVDGFVTEAELKALQKAGAIGEIVGWAFDAEGQLIKGATNDRVASAPIPSRESSLVVGVAKGEKKLPGVLAATRRRLINGLITDEAMARGLLAHR
ncbi:MAG: sugar-binding transcriptional regulator [Alphaproteobacteria bacterium]